LVPYSNLVMRCLALLAISLSLAKCQSSKEDVCKYSCLDEGRCQVRYTGPSRSGYTKGVCFRGGNCYWTPQECQDCNLVKNCDSSQEEECPANGKFPNSEIFCLNEDGSSNCQQASDCPTPDGCVKVKKDGTSLCGHFVNVPENHCKIVCKPERGCDQQCSTFNGQKLVVSTATSKQSFRGPPIGGTGQITNRCPATTPCSYKSGCGRLVSHLPTWFNLTII